MRITCMLLCCSALMAFAAPRSAQAVEPSSRTIYVDEYQKGRDVLKIKDWSKGYEIFSALWEKSKTFDVAINLGQAELMLGKHREAAEHLAFGIRNAPPASAESADAARGGLAKAKKAIGTLKISAPEGAEIFVDGKSIGTAPITAETFVDPGSVRLSAKHASLGNGELTAEVGAGEEKSVEIRLGAALSNATGQPLKPPYGSEALNDRKGVVRAPVNPPPEPERKSGIETKTIVLIVGGAVTAIAGGTAVYFGLKARSDRKDAESLVAKAERDYGTDPCSSGNVAASNTCSKIEDKIDDHDKAGRVFNVVLPITIGAAAGTALLYLVWPRGHSDSSRTTALAPIIDHRTGGLVLSGSF